VARSQGKTGGRATSGTESFLPYTTARKPSLGTGRKGANYIQKAQIYLQNKSMVGLNRSISLSKEHGSSIKAHYNYPARGRRGVTSVAGTELRQHPQLRVPAGQTWVPAA